jgi:hypothetical protein
MPAASTAAGVVRGFVERPGARYMTRLQLDRLKKAGSDLAIQQLAKDSKGTVASVVLTQLARPMSYLRQHRAKLLLLLLCGSLSMTAALLINLKRTKKQLGQCMTAVSHLSNPFSPLNPKLLGLTQPFSMEQVQKTQLLLYYRLNKLKRRFKTHWEPLCRDLDTAVNKRADNTAFSGSVTVTEALVCLLFDELETLTAEKAAKKSPLKASSRASEQEDEEMKRAGKQTGIRGGSQVKASPKRAPRAPRSPHPGDGAGEVSL